MRFYTIASVAAASLVAAAAASAAALHGLPEGAQRLLAAAAAPERKKGPGEDSHLSVPKHNFYFSRAQYTANGVYPGWKDWQTDYPKADRQFLVVLKRLATLDAYEREFAIRLDAAELRTHPFLYASEAGQMQLTEAEVAGLRQYLLAGGFLVVDDFWGSQEWRAFETQMKRVLPEYRIVDLPLDHPLFHAFYDIEEIVQVPNVGQGVAGGPTHEQDGYIPRVRGIMDEAGRLLVVANWNTDMADAWEWAENPQYPLKYSTFAYQMGVNLIVYSMSH